MTRSFISNLEPWKLHAGGGGVVVVLTLVAYVFGLRPLVLRSGEAAILGASLSSQQEKAVELGQDANMIEASLNRIVKKLEENPLKLQLAAFRNERLAQLTELAAKSGLNVDGIQTRKLTQLKRYDMVPITLTGSGMFPDCVKFLHQLNQRFPDTGVKAFTIQGTPGVKPKVSNFKFDMVWYASPSGKDAIEKKE